MEDEIRIVECDPRWPARFGEEAARVRAALGDQRVVAVEHFGSTSVPGLAAKPIIDILVAARSLGDIRDVAIEELGALGYAFWYDNPDQAHLFFVKGLPPNGPRSHHVHIVEPGETFTNRLLFRDYLRANPDEAARYQALKRSLAEQHHADREAYTDAKGEYVRAVLEKARADRRGAAAV